MKSLRQPTTTFTNLSKINKKTIRNIKINENLLEKQSQLIKTNTKKHLKRTNNKIAIKKPFKTINNN